MIRPFSESALLVDGIGAETAQQLAASQARDPIHGVVEVVPGLTSVLVEFEPDADAATLVPVVTQRLEHSRDPGSPGRVRRIPVVYGGDHGPDLDEVARLCDLAPDEVIRRHVATELRVLFGGFAPGFAYLGELPSELRVPRLETPRVRTPPGSVAIADAMTGIYPAALPGG
ncbi:MAG: allophanate hydrolase subunit 1, partial [Chloroflexi bacterium]|nr:allophanate hydrolase subunit 1 [Chloroflexota bacterium]